MKLQSLSIIFIIIIMPITLVLSAYNRMQIKSIKMQTYYDTKLTGAVYDAIKAYNINIRNNPASIHEASRKRDIEASNQAFITSLTTGLGIGGYGEDYIKPYIPAVIYTLYNGFYVYAPTYNEKNSRYEHMLKPYITYSARYKKGTTDVTISYTLDNYITVIGEIDGEYYNESGYLLEDDINTTSENLTENLLYLETVAENEEFKKDEFTYVYNGGTKRYWHSEKGNWFIHRKGRVVSTYEELDMEDSNALEYVEKAQKFNMDIMSKLEDITAEHMIVAGKTYNELVEEYDIYSGTSIPIFLYDSVENKFEKEDSVFNMHKKDVMKVIILEELRTSIANYNTHSGALDVNYNFKVPILTDEEWNTITTNISITAFMQGLQIGFKTYNSYVTVTNTENYDYSTKENLCFINLDENNSQYHMIDCPKLTGTRFIGYRKVDFELSSAEINSEEIQYYYKHTNLPCYNCIVNRNYEKETVLSSAKQQALNNALARERNMLHY